MRKIFVLFAYLSLSFFTAFSQDSADKYSKDWSYAIDTTWGPGLPTEQKLEVFNNWWDRIDQTWGGFPNIKDEWDSLKTFYYPIIEAGVSNGRFQGILGRLTRSLKEAHSFISNSGIDSIFNIYDSEFEHFPSFPSFCYKPGVPALHLSAIFNRNYFGAGVTAYNDSIALIYSVMPNHPLDLQPGDIILGYDGIPWSDNLQDLFNQELPLIYGGFLMGSSEESIQHINTSSVGLNWGLFDTIDILKYSSGDTVHYPTSLLNNISWPYPETLPVREQLPVSGVPFIDNSDPTPVIWGIVEGTSIGYIYVYLWSKLTPVQKLFKQAIDSLMHVHNVKGLILDFRLNGGGQQFTANDGFKHIFNEDPTGYFCDYVRADGGGHLDFKLTDGMITEGFFTPTSELFDHPIAVLTGPECLSWGDMNGFRMRFHPMSRFFGKGTNGAFVTYDLWQNISYAFKNYSGMVYNGSIFSKYDNEGYMIHKGNPVDEKVWFTPAGVASGQDEVVKRALEWINNLVYPHDVTCGIFTPGKDTIHIKAIVENPDAHQLSTMAYIHTLNNILVDSVNLTGSGTYLEGVFNLPSAENFYKVSVTVFDNTASDHFNFPNAARFTTVPLTIDSLEVFRYNDTMYSVKPYLKNLSSATTIKNIEIILKSSDPRITRIAPDFKWCQNILPGQTGAPAQGFAVVMKEPVGGNFNLSFSIKSGIWKYWEIDTNDIFLEVQNEKDLIPSEYYISQNYPNPFNSSSMIKYSIPLLSKVVIKIFNITGEEVEKLVDEELYPGYYSVQWNAGKLPSGIYFYQLKAGEFVETRKMVLLK